MTSEKSKLRAELEASVALERKAASDSDDRVVPRYGIYPDPAVKVHTFSRDIPGVTAPGTTEALLQQRGTVHGAFRDNAEIASAMMRALDGAPNRITDDTLRTGLFMALHKVARAVSGDLLFQDHWDDFVGYATLCQKRVRELNEKKIGGKS